MKGQLCHVWIIVVRIEQYRTGIRRYTLSPTCTRKTMADDTHSLRRTGWLKGDQRTFTEMQSIIQGRQRAGIRQHVTEEDKHTRSPILASRTDETVERTSDCGRRNTHVHIPVCRFGLR